MGATLPGVRRYQRSDGCSGSDPIFEMRCSERPSAVVRFDGRSHSTLMSAHCASATFGKLWNADPVRPLPAPDLALVVSRDLLDAAPLADRLRRVR
jgi:hypothetical protein